MEYGLCPDCMNKLNENSALMTKPSSIFKGNNVYLVLFFGLSYLGLNPLMRLENWIINGLFKITGMGSGTVELGLFNFLLSYLDSLVYAA